MNIADHGFTTQIVDVKPYFIQFMNSHKDIELDFYESCKGEIINHIIKWAFDNVIMCNANDDSNVYDLKN